MNRSRLCISILVSVCLVTVSSCSRTMPVRWWSEGDVGIVGGAAYRVETRDGRVYTTDRLSRTDSTFVMRSLEQPSGKGIWGSGGDFFEVDPIVLRVDEVQSIERVGREEILFESVEGTNFAYRIETTDGQKFTAARIATSDSALTIHALFVTGKVIEVDPIVLPRDSLQSFEAQEINRGRTTLVLLGVAAVGLVIGALAMFHIPAD